MKKLLLLLLFAPLVGLAQDQDYFVNGINIKDIKSKNIQIHHQDSQNKKSRVIVDYGQDIKPSETSKRVLKDAYGKDVRILGATQVLNLFPEYELKYVRFAKDLNSRYIFYLQLDD